MDEQRWIERILAGDTQSFSCLVMKYEKMAYTIAYRILENREEAEEAVQDAFVKAYQALATFRFGSKFSTWFYRIVYHTALSALRRGRSFTEYEEAGSLDLTTDELETASSILERNDRQEIISGILKELPADDSLLLTLYYLEECSVEEIRQITDWTPSNIKTKLFRGRKRFYETLQKKMKSEIYNLL